MNDVGELLRMCAEIGYRISLNGDKIRFDFIGETMPPDAVIAPLVHSLRERKLEVVEFLRQGESGKAVDFDLLFKQAAHEIAGKYTGGEIAFARENRPELFNQSVEAENRLNRYWGNDFPAFGKAVEDWKSVCLSMIDLHRNAQKYLCACGNPGERLMLGIRAGKYGGHWYCLKCRPYQNT